MLESTRRDFVCTGAMAALGASVVGAAPAIAEEGQAQPAQPTIYIIDRIVAKPGMGKELYETYMARFEPFAEQRGLKLEHAIIAPPVWIVDEVSSNTLEFMWSVEGYGQFARSITYGNSEAADWWAGIEAKAVSRDRSYFATVEDAEVLSNV